MELNNCKQLWLLALVLLAATATNADALNFLRRMRQKPLDVSESEFRTRDLKSEKSVKKSEKSGKNFNLKGSKTEKFMKEAKSGYVKGEEFGKKTKDGKSFKFTKLENIPKVGKSSKILKVESIPKVGKSSKILKVESIPKVGKSSKILKFEKYGNEQTSVETRQVGLGPDDDDAVFMITMSMSL